MKYIVKVTSVFLLLCMFFACSNPVDGKSPANNNANNSTTDSDNPSSPIVVNRFGVKFDFENAKALAKLEAKTDRAVSNVDDLGDLVKILEDGTMENAITVGENCSLSDIVAIYKSPLETSKDIFIVFNGESSLGYRDEEVTDEWGNSYTNTTTIRVGQLICLHSDGSIADILEKENPTDYWNTHMSLKTESVTFDANGNLYFISSDNGDMIYQFNPQTNNQTKMVASVENTWYDKMQIDNEGQWIFVSGNRGSAYFLRAIPINNPNAFVNIYYSSNYNIGTDKWAYDDKNGIIYFIVYDGGTEGLFNASKAAGFKNKKKIQSIVGAIFSDNIFDSFYESSDSFYWLNEFKTNKIFDSEKAINCVINSLRSYYDSKQGKNINITKDDIDIRFDKYLTASGRLKALAVITKGKKNEDAFEALNNDVGIASLHNLDDSRSQDEEGNLWFENIRGEGYKNSFLADILYLKGTDTLLAESDSIVLEYYDYVRDDNDDVVYNEGEPQFLLHSITGKDFFEKNSNGLYNSSDVINFVSYEEYKEQVYAFNFSDKYFESDGKLNSKAIIEYFFDYCNLEGSKEFRLTAFKNDTNYGDLYSELTNEAAIEWLFDDVERLNLFAKYCGLYCESRWENEVWKDTIQLN